ncbi:MMR_HSR1 domain-containing protein [Cephalotus follicularis]|uniref:MMR_HSR1 domain-containing protein n=1 Tax=Cephalotus follicularis TaxID=3775 RepID=A0A1Q3B0T9_CEPFO|nr:MMR_HSR1 domain-containing protein [Cephalotus follicularis]
MAAATTSTSSKIARYVFKAARGRGGWYGPHMAAASRAIAERIPLVDLILEVRDATIPLSSECEQLRNYPPSSSSSSSTKRIIVLNKVDLASRANTKDWINYFNRRNYISYGVNAHNKNNVKEFLNFLQARVRELKKTDHSSHATTIMLLGIPNVGKSALANSLHQIGRISAVEKGKLKHAIVSPYPGETKDINSLKIGSHPNIYLLDTPGILPPQILDVDVYAKLALTGVIRYCMVGEKELARYVLSVINLSDEYEKWGKLSTYEDERSSLDLIAESSSGPALEIKQKKQYPTDHTQDFIVNDVRRTLFHLISCSVGHLEREEDMVELIEAQFAGLRIAFRVTVEGDHARDKVAAKLLNLYRTGRLGHYTLDRVPTHYVL